MKLPEDPQLEDLTKEQLVHLVRTKFWMISKMDLVHTIYEVASEQALNDMDKFNNEAVAMGKLRQDCTYEEWVEHNRKWKALHKKWERAQKNSEQIYNWYEKQRETYNAQNNKNKRGDK